MAFRRFLALTGAATRVIYSDNGSNFHGAEAELKRGLKRLQKKLPFNDLAFRGVEFRFNPPLASHQGGVFESIIRLVRKVMTALMDDKKLHNLTEFCKFENFFCNTLNEHLQLDSPLQANDLDMHIHYLQKKASQLWFYS